MITKEQKAEIIKEYALKEGDTGSPEVAGCYPDCQNQRSQRTPEDPQEGSPLQKRSAEDGWTEKKPSQLPEGCRCRKI